MRDRKKIKNYNETVKKTNRKERLGDCWYQGNGVNMRGGSKGKGAVVAY